MNSVLEIDVLCVGHASYDLIFTHFDTGERFTRLARKAPYL